MQKLNSPIRGYSWGSRDFIAKVQLRDYPSSGPEAELWVGAHPDSPSTVEGVGLDRLIAANPVGLLGQAAVDTFGSRLPFLMKLLAAREPLSLQAHPNADQAREGFAAKHPSYVDPHHKPELMLALESFEALCGFRDPGESALVLARIPGLEPVSAALAAGDLRAAVRTLLTWPQAQRAELVARAAAREPLAARLAAHYPDDMGVIVALLLNEIRLEPGEAVWMPAGTLHAYLCGAGVEVMASSDNVLRGGLTPKEINIPELLRILRFEPIEVPRIEARRVADGVDTWPVPVPDFRLTRVRVDGPAIVLDPEGPRALICVAGEVTVKDAMGEITLASGESAFGSAGAGPLTFSGAAEVFLASL